VIVISSGEVSEIKRKTGKTIHWDCFGSSGPLYYFGRAWYSSVRVFVSQPISREDSTAQNFLFALAPPSEAGS
jgi:hypothetical protein